MEVILKSGVGICLTAYSLGEKQKIANQIKGKKKNMPVERFVTDAYLPEKYKSCII